MIKPASLALALLVMLLACTACDSNQAAAPWSVDLSGLTQDQALLTGRWLLRKNCGTLGCTTYHNQDSPEIVVFYPNGTVRFYYDGALGRERTYRIVEQAFANHYFGLTSGLEIGGGSMAEFGVNESIFYMSTGRLDGPSKWYERLRDRFSSSKGYPSKEYEAGA